MDRETVSEIVRHSLNEAFAALHGRGAGEWTKEIKTRLCVAGAAQQPPLYVCASGIEAADNGEWLYDVCSPRYGEAGHVDVVLELLGRPCAVQPRPHELGTGWH